MKISDDPTAVAAVVIDGDKVLLHKRRDFRVWALPGGGIEAEESASDAAIREVREETGYEIDLIRLVGEYRVPQLSTACTHIFLGCVTGGEAISQGPETRAVSWFHPARLPWTLGKHHHVYIGDALQITEEVVTRTIAVSPITAWAKRVARRLRYG